MDTCQKKKHMFLGLGLLVLITIVVLVIESRYAGSGGGSRRRTQQFVIEYNSSCYQQERYTVVQECHPCSEFDIVSKSLGVCIHTHYKELLRCENSGEIVTRSCDRVALIAIRNFITFEIFCFVLGVLSYFVSYSRDRILSHRTHLKIEQQLNKL